MNPLHPFRTIRTLVVAALAACTFLFASAPARAETAPPAAPPAQQPADPAKPEAAAKPAARREDVEPETLPAALASLKTARTERDAAETDLAAALAAHDKTKQILSSTLAIATTAKTERDTAQTALAGMTAERAKAITEHGRTKELLTLAEAACGVAGVSPANAVPAAPAPAAKASVADYERRIAAAKTPAEQQAIAREFEKAHAEGRVG